MKTNLSGGCLCGGTRYLLEAEPTDRNECHCLDCRRSSGAACVAWGTVDRAKWRLVGGELRKIPHAGRIRSFAACCGTQLLFEEAADAPTVDVTLASLDEPAPFAPEITIWTEDRLPWATVNPHLPSYRRSSRDG